MSISNMGITDVPVESVKSKLTHKTDAMEYRHPSYGMVKFSRGCVSGGGEPLFGAKHPSSSIMTLTISKAQNTQDLGKNWYYDYEKVTEVVMTPVQYAELISNPNTQGVPCTIKYSTEDGRIVYKPHGTEIEYLEEKIKDSVSNLSSNLRGKKERARELLTQKGTLKKADKEELLKLFLNMETEMSSSIPFYKESMEKSLDKMVMEANSDIESLVVGVQTKLGKLALKNPDFINNLMLENKEK